MSFKLYRISFIGVLLSLFCKGVNGSCHGHKHDKGESENDKRNLESILSGVVSHVKGMCTVCIYTQLQKKHTIYMFYCSQKF